MLFRILQRYGIERNTAENRAITNGRAPNELSKNERVDIMVQTIILPDGYLVEERTSEHDLLWTADKLRSARWRNQYTFAERIDNNTAVLKGSVIVCPYCGKVVPAYDNSTALRVTELAIERWTNLQLSMFEPAPKRLAVHDLLQLPEEHKCPRCLRSSGIKLSNREMTLRYHRKKLSLECKSLNAKLIQLLFTRESCPRDFRLTFPFTERLTLNLRSGHTYISMIGNDGSTRACWDITFCPDLAPYSTIVELLKEYPVLMRKLVRAFEHTVGSACPYRVREMTLKRLVLLNLFQRYPKQFYDAVPLNDNHVLDRDSRSIARKLHCAEDAEKLLRHSAVPNVKSVRRLLFSQPGLFFYLTELEELWQLLGDYNRFCWLIQEVQNIFRILVYLRQFPAVVVFLKDYISTLGSGPFCRDYARGQEAFLRYGLQYSCMNTRMQKNEQGKWRKKTNDYDDYTMAAFYSIPEITDSQHRQDALIDGYLFSYLRSSAEFQQAGEALHNCLGQYRPRGDGVVVVVKQLKDVNHDEEKPVAAIELRGKRIRQVYGTRNTMIQPNTALDRAILKWEWKNNLIWAVDEDEDEEDEEDEQERAV